MKEPPNKNMMTMININPFTTTQPTLTTPKNGAPTSPRGFSSPDGFNFITQPPNFEEELYYKIDN
jgi:hypothetical protein